MYICSNFSKNNIGGKIHFKGAHNQMKKEEMKGQSHYIYDQQGESSVSAQIMDAYNSGVIDQPNGQFDNEKYDNMFGNESE
jgi:hypothetical protein